MSQTGHWCFLKVERDAGGRCMSKKSGGQKKGSVLIGAEGN